MTIARGILLLLLTGFTRGAQQFLLANAERPDGGGAGGEPFLRDHLAEPKQAKTLRPPEKRDVIAVGLLTGLAGGTIAILLQWLLPYQRGRGEIDFGPPPTPEWALLLSSVLYGLVLHGSYFRRIGAERPLNRAMVTASLGCIAIRFGVGVIHLNVAAVFLAIFGALPFATNVDLGDLCHRPRLGECRGKTAIRRKSTDRKAGDSGKAAALEMVDGGLAAFDLELGEGIVTEGVFRRFLLIAGARSAVDRDGVLPGLRCHRSRLLLKDFFRCRRSLRLARVLRTLVSRQRTDHHIDPAANQLRREIRVAIRSDIFNELIDHLEPELGVSHLATTEFQGDLHFHILAEEIDGMAGFNGKIVRINFRAELNLFDLGGVLVLPGFLVTLGLLVTKLAEINQPAHRGRGIGRDLDKINTIGARHVQRITQG